MSVIENIGLYTSQYGKARLILKDCRYFIECEDQRIYKNLLQIDEV